MPQPLYESQRHAGFGDGGVCEAAAKDSTGALAGGSNKLNRFSCEVKSDAWPLLGFSVEDRHVVEGEGCEFLAE